jgi:hypothetical protein
VCVCVCGGVLVFYAVNIVRMGVEERERERARPFSLDADARKSVE